MTDPNDIRRAWASVNGWRVPSMTDEERIEWGQIIESMTADQFATAMSGARNRPAERVHLRPGTQEFRSLAVASGAPKILPNDVRAPHPDGPAPTPDQARNLARLAELQAQLDTAAHRRRQSEVSA